MEPFKTVGISLVGCTTVFVFCHVKYLTQLISNNKQENVRRKPNRLKMAGMDCESKPADKFVEKQGGF